jgi:hypothetical protein
MKLTLAYCGIFALLGASGLSAQTASMYLTSAGTDIMDGVYVDPYYATVNGVANTLVICDDYADNSFVGEAWTANIYNSSQLSETRNTEKWDLTPAQQTQDYNEAAYLSLELMSAFASGDKLAQGEITFAIWGVFDPTAIPSLTAWNSADGLAAQGYLNGAEAQTYTVNEFPQVGIYSPNLSDSITCNGGTCLTAPPQEFLIVHAAEAPAPVVLGFDLVSALCVAFMLRRRLVPARLMLSAAKK